MTDTFSFANKLEKFSNKAVQPIWRDAWKAKEVALRTRFVQTSEKLNEHSKNLEELTVGDRCFVQNQTGNHPKRWDRTGVVVDAGRNDQYTVKIDGSGRVTLRNRRFLRKFKPASMVIQAAPSPVQDTPSLSIVKDPRQSQHTPVINDATECQDFTTPPMVVPDTPLQPADHSVVPSQLVVPTDSPQQDGPAAATKMPTALKRLLSHN